jgi:hypothetical protein
VLLDPGTQLGAVLGFDDPEPFPLRSTCAEGCEPPLVVDNQYLHVCVLHPQSGQGRLMPDNAVYLVDTIPSDFICRWMSGTPVTREQASHLGTSMAHAWLHVTVGQRQISTGTALDVSTRVAWLPSRTRPSPRRPWEAMTDEVATLALAVSMMPSAGKSFTRTVSQATSCFFAAAQPRRGSARRYSAAAFSILLDRKANAPRRSPWPSRLGGGNGRDLGLELRGKGEAGGHGLAGQLRPVGCDQEVLVHGNLLVSQD